MKSTPAFRGPSLVLLGSVHILIMVAGLVVVAVLRHGAPYVNPFADGETVRAFFASNPTAVRVGSFFLFASAIPLGLFTVTVVDRLRFVGVRATGTSIAHFGGYIAATSLVLSGLSGWVLSVPGVQASSSVVSALYFLSFLFGGAAFAVGFGLLTAGVAITGHFARLFPTWLTLLGLLIASAGELSSFSLLAYPANFLIPITRYLGFVWLLVVAFKLSRIPGREADHAVSESAKPIPI